MPSWKISQKTNIKVIQSVNQFYAGRYIGSYPKNLLTSNLEHDQNLENVHIQHIQHNPTKALKIQGKTFSGDDP